MPFTKFTPFTKQEICLSPEHYPPTMINLEPGKHTYVCPSCGKETIINIPLITC